ncbi:hypothetical protein BCR44DRAFT_27399 [Catenaria anguillulae PL171]|uniref:Uncharacterized protein n=1 Tax=Catenaria anguillulae PL171 TaxID=765915 RepID=A0A1Y2H8H8_9FUNG|nr:hypothetical protein BCR44DRAFT_27399 [Catenaria anguillulae PL171]
MMSAHINFGLKNDGKLDQTNWEIVACFGKKSPTIMTNSNVDRHKINWAVIHKIAHKCLIANSTPDEDDNINPDLFRVFLLLAALGVNESVPELTDSEKQQIRSHNDHDTGNLLALLPVFVGMRINAFPLNGPALDPSLPPS